MKRLTPVVCLLLLAATLFAQGAASPDGPDLRMFLEFSNEQVASLHELQQELRDRVQPVAEQIAETERQLKAALESGAANPLTVGELVLQIHEGQREVAAIRLDERQRTTAVLPPEQQDKLNPLHIAALLRTAGAQAAEVNLIGPGDSLD